jgi:hypothetical protein
MKATTLFMGRARFAVILCATLTASREAPAAIIGQVDTFEDGTTQNWAIGLLGASHPAPPLNQPSGGPAGANDNYLQLTSIGAAGPGSRLAAINFMSQWAGDYTAVGIGAISMDVRNLGTSDLVLRLLLSDPSLDPPQNAVVSTSVLVPAGGGWTTITIPVTPESLTPLFGTVSSALANVTEVRLFHSPNTSFPGPPHAALLGVDNITAQAVPEPSTGVLFGGGLLVLGNVVRRRL